MLNSSKVGLLPTIHRHISHPLAAFSFGRELQKVLCFFVLSLGFSAVFLDTVFHNLNPNSKTCCTYFDVWHLLLGSLKR